MKNDNNDEKIDFSNIKPDLITKAGIQQLTAIKNVKDLSNTIIFLDKWDG